MRYCTLLSLTFLFSNNAFPQTAIDPASIDIVRDAFGVPHIFSKTDAGVSYGLAWAHAEDDFKTIQQSLLASKAMLGAYSGKSGAAIDYFVHFLKCRELVDNRYEKEISTDYKAVLQGYCSGLNAYAKAHPKEVLLKKLFPATPKDILTFSVLQLAVSTGANGALKKIMGGNIPHVTRWEPGGSNAYAFNSKITSDGNVYLAINSHQPLEGPVAWYEAHLCSEEGWNIIGALFPGSPNILLGCNEYLGWAHTVNYPDKLDVYQLELNPLNKNQYKLDGQWENLEVSKVKLKVKIAGLRITVKKEVYASTYGPTMVTEKGTFAIRTGALMEIRALEEWYRMNKARNFAQFKKALDMNAIAGYNIVYADKYDTIFYLSNGKLPLRNKNYNWASTLPGNTSTTLWKDFHPTSDLPQVLNPASGYLYNSNHSPFNATAVADNIQARNYDATMGYETHDNNRSKRFMELIKSYTKINYADFKLIKYDLQLPSQLAYRTNCDTLFMLNAVDYPAVSDLITTLSTWDRKASIESKGATLFTLLYYYVSREQEKIGVYPALTKVKCIKILTYIKETLIKNFGTTQVSLGDYQKLVRGQKEIALPGLPDVIASMLSVPHNNGKVKGNQGESYIELVKFTPLGPEIESINCYGASNKSSSPHFADQMELFVQQKTKPMTLNKEKVYKDAKQIYHPQ